MQGLLCRAWQCPLFPPSRSPLSRSSSHLNASHPVQQLLHHEDQDHHDPPNLPHLPVLLPQVLAAFRDSRLRTFVDCTLGAGGHASAIIEGHAEMKTFVGLDVDPIAHAQASPRLQETIKRRTTSEMSSNLDVRLFQTNFRNVKSVLEKLDLMDHGVDGIMMDLGMSSMQLNVAKRGFSLQQDGPLDMRMDPSSALSADDILNNWPESEIGRIFREYGDERHWKRIARNVSELQLAGGVHSTSKLLEIIQRSLPAKFSAGRSGWKKTAIRVFQALRIAVNDELGALEAALSDAYACLGSKGRLAVISFQSLEDRIVKQFFLKVVGENESIGAVNGDSAVQYKMQCTKHVRSRWSKDEKQIGDARNKILEGKQAIVWTKKPIIAGTDEIKQNQKARSAKLRILEKK